MEACVCVPTSNLRLGDSHAKQLGQPAEASVNIQPGDASLNEATLSRLPPDAPAGRETEGSETWQGVTRLWDRGKWTPFAGTKRKGGTASSGPIKSVKFVKSTTTEPDSSGGRKYVPMQSSSSPEPDMVPTQQSTREYERTIADETTEKEKEKIVAATGLEANAIVGADTEGVPLWKCGRYGVARRGYGRYQPP